MAFESLEPRWAMSHVAQGLVDSPQTYSGTLNGKIVFTSGGHGWKGSGTSYTVDRPEYWQDKDANGNVIDAGQIRAFTRPASSITAVKWISDASLTVRAIPI